MRMRLPGSGVGRVGCIPFLVVLLLTPAIQPAIAQETEEEPELDMVVTTTLITTKEHTAKYREALRKSAAKAIESLKPKVYADDEKPKDGAARFRLLVEHNGSVLIGDVPFLTRGRDEQGGERIAWQLQTSQDGQIAFRFLQWSALRYKPLGGWSIPAGQDAPGGRIEVAAVTLAPGQPRPQAMPISIQEAQTKALDALTPRDLERALLEGLIRVDLLRADIVEPGDRPRGGAEVGVANLSPWPLQRVEVAVEFGEPNAAFRLLLNHSFDKPLPSRGTASFSGTGFTGQADGRRLNPPRAQSASFGRAPAAPAKPAPAPRKR